MRLFRLERDEDESGMSGVGVVAMGAEYPSGRCVMEWIVPPFTMGWYQAVQDVETVHGHQGKTRVIWLDEVERPPLGSDKGEGA